MLLEFTVPSIDRAQDESNKVANIKTNLLMVTNNITITKEMCLKIHHQPESRSCFTNFKLMPFFIFQLYSPLIANNNIISNKWMCNLHMLIQSRFIEVVFSNATSGKFVLDWKGGEFKYIVFMLSRIVILSCCQPIYWQPKFNCWHSCLTDQIVSSTWLIYLGFWRLVSVHSFNWMRWLRNMNVSVSSDTWRMDKYPSK